MRLKFVLPGAYLALAVYAWIDSLRRPKDGLANVGLMLVTLPVTLLGFLLTWATGLSRGFVLLPSGLGYYTSHALYFWPSVALIAALLYWLCSVLGGR
jgi:hypothetical protein